MNLLLYSSLAIAPGLAVCIFIYWRDKFEKEPLRLLIFSFFSGCVCTIPAVAIQMACNHWGFGLPRGLFNTAIHTFIVVALSEELCKFWFLKRYYRHSAFNQPYDGITYAVMVSMGFATVENLLYVLGSEKPIESAVVRMFTAVPAHATFGVMMGFFVGMAKFRPRYAFWYMLLGLLIAVLFHGSYDFFLYTGATNGTWLGAVFSLFLGLWLSLRAIKIHTGKAVFVLEGIMPDDDKEE